MCRPTGLHVSVVAYDSCNTKFVLQLSLAMTLGYSQFPVHTLWQKYPVIQET